MLKPALVVLDIQKYLIELSPGPVVPNLRRACAIIDRVANGYRKKGLPVVWVYHGSGRISEDSPEFAMVEMLKPQEGDFRVVKTRGNALEGTHLWQILKDNGVNFAVLAGWRAGGCMLATCRGFEEQESMAWALLKDCVLGDESVSVDFLQHHYPLLNQEAAMQLRNLAGSR